MMDLSKYDNSEYYPGAGSVKRILWFCINAAVFHSWIFPVSSIKCNILRLFGAQVGRGVVIKPRVNIKYPWNITIGNHVWIGEGSWLDSLARIKVGNNVCISQEAYLLTGNHNYKDPNFSLITEEIDIEDGVWLGAKSIVCPGVSIREGSILTVGSVLTSDTEPKGIYRGNPAVLFRQREFKK